MLTLEYLPRVKSACDTKKVGHVAEGAESNPASTSQLTARLLLYAPTSASTLRLSHHYHHTTIVHIVFSLLRDLRLLKRVPIGSLYKG